MVYYCRRGFTLIELSIVLVIIALVAGGVMVGRDMIEQSKIRSTIGQLEKFSTAANTFRSKYNCLPGDCANAVILGLGVATHPGANGNGNGAVNTDNFMFQTNNGSRTQETFNFWYHLARANLIEDQGYTGYTPITSFPGSFEGYAPQSTLKDDVYINAVSINTAIAGDVVFGNSFYIALASSSGLGYSYGLTAPQAFSIDSKLDDGLPTSGNVQTMYAYSGPRVTNSWSCNEGTTGIPRYDVQGRYVSYAALSTPPDPGRIKCAIAVSKAF